MRWIAPNVTLDCLRWFVFVNPLPGSFVGGARPVAP